MSVFKRLVKGKPISPNYYYRFMVNKRTFFGTTGTTDKDKAREFERKEVQRLRQNKSVKALVENFREYLTGDRVVAIAGVWDKFATALRDGRRKPLLGADGELTQNAMAKKAVWDDFAAFLKANHPDVKTLGQVTEPIANEYLGIVRDSGRFNPEVQFHAANCKRKRRRLSKYTREITKPSNRTANAYHCTLIEIVDRLASEASIEANPFRKIGKLAQNTEGREPFTPAELKLIHDAASADADPDGGPYVYPLFMIGVHTGLREGDICTLRWDEIDLTGGWINRKMNKTGRVVRVPLLPALRDWLTALPQEGEYVLPRHANDYEKNRTGISWRVAKFLKAVGIQTTRTVEGRQQCASIKDVHSLRHTFVYLAGASGIPLPVVQGIVGHMTVDMTKRYMDHATDELKQAQVATLPALFGRARPALPAKAADTKAMLKNIGERLPTATAEQLQKITAILTPA